MKVGDLFSGIGGFSLAARWMGWRTAWFCENNPYASAVLAKHWPGVPNLGDITQADFTRAERVRLVCLGFPCQNISPAGGKEGIGGEHSGLWCHAVRALRELLPEWIVGENSSALLWRGWPVVRRDLRALGYRVARPVIMSASAVGAPHRRERLWFVAHLDRGRQLQPQGCITESRRWAVHCDRWSSEPAMARVVHGVPRRLDRTSRLGNAIVPQCAAAIFAAIEEHEARVAEVT